MDNLSKPVAWAHRPAPNATIEVTENTYVARSWSEFHGRDVHPLYSQEYVSALLADNEYMRWRIKEIDLLFGKNLLAMRAAVIESEHGEGHAAGMQWIFNTLFGPGEFAPANETDAQDYFNREAEKIDVEFSKCMAFFTAHHEARRGQAIDKFSEPVTKNHKLNSPEITDGWVSCEERMPEEGDVVLVCQEGGIIYCAEMQDGELYPDEFPRVPSEGREITHWMPLPAAPEVRRDDA